MDGDVINQILDIIESGSFKFILYFVIIYLGIFWISVVLWVTKDITNRTTNLLYQIFSILLVVILTPIFGLFIYLIIRPQKTISEKYYEDVGIEILENNEESKCPQCGMHIIGEYIYCPHCGENINKECIKCKKLIYKKYDICPYCGVNQKEKPKSKKTKNKKEKKADKDLK